MVSKNTANPVRDQPLRDPEAFQWIGALVPGRGARLQCRDRARVVVSPSGADLAAAALGMIYFDSAPFPTFVFEPWPAIRIGAEGAAAL